MAGCGNPSGSASTIVPSIARGYHILRVNGYIRTLTKAIGEHLASPPFTVGGHRWHIRYYPNGSTSEAKDYISVYLHLHDSVAKPVTTEIKFCFGNMAGQPLTREGVHSFYNNSAGWGWAMFIKRKDFEASKHLRDNSFAIRCDVIVINEFHVERASMISVPPSDLQQHLGGLLRTEKGTDVVFDVAGETFAAHRVVLAARSTVFNAELFGGMKESDTGVVVRIEDMEPWVFKALLDFIYTDLFPTTKTTKEAEEGGVGGGDKVVFPRNLLRKEGEEGDIYVLSQHLLVAADRYNLERLKSLCESKLCECIDVGTVAIILALAEQHNCHELKKVCFHFLSSLANLRASLASDDFKHLRRSCPSVMEELFDMLAT